jgi:hypothetical protein
MADLKSPDTLYRALGERLAADAEYVVIAAVVMYLLVLMPDRWNSSTQSPCLVPLCIANRTSLSLAPLPIFLIFVFYKRGLYDAIFVSKCRLVRRGQRYTFCPILHILSLH